MANNFIGSLHIDHCLLIRVCQLVEAHSHDSVGTVKYKNHMLSDRMIVEIMRNKLLSGPL